MRCAKNTTVLSTTSKEQMSHRNADSLLTYPPCDERLRRCQAKASTGQATMHAISTTICHESNGRVRETRPCLPSSVGRSIFRDDSIWVPSFLLSLVDNPTQAQWHLPCSRERKSGRVVGWWFDKAGLLQRSWMCGRHHHRRSVMDLLRCRDLGRKERRYIMILFIIPMMHY